MADVQIDDGIIKISIWKSKIQKPPQSSPNILKSAGRRFTRRALKIGLGYLKGGRAKRLKRHPHEKASQGRRAAGVYLRVVAIAKLWPHRLRGCDWARLDADSRRVRDSAEGLDRLRLILQSHRHRGRPA